MSVPFRVLLTDRGWPDSRIEREILGEMGAELIEAPTHDEPTLIELAREADAIATNWAPVTETVVRATTRCRLIARLGIGLDNIAVATATELGIPVTNVPDYCVDEVADHALAMLLAGTRKVALYHHQAKLGRYDRQAGPPLRRLAGRVLGLVGFGRIAQSLYPKAGALGLEVIAHSRSGDDHGSGCPMVSFDELLARSDFVSLHLPLSDGNRRMFDNDAFGRMKPMAYLVNTSRGGLIDHGALYEALTAGRLAGAALDVFDPEPPDLSLPLFQNERVIVTPHAAFVSEESLVDLRTRVAHQIVQALQGARPEHVVNPHVYATSR